MGNDLLSESNSSSAIQGFGCSRSLGRPNGTHPTTFAIEVTFCVYVSPLTPLQQLRPEVFAWAALALERGLAQVQWRDTENFETLDQVDLWLA